MPFSEEVTIRHGMFWYFAKEEQVVPGKDGQLEEKQVLVQRVASQNEKVTLEVESDYRRGIEHHAFWTEDELKSPAVLTPDQQRGELLPPAIETGGAGHSSSGAGGGSDEDDDEVQDPTDVDVATLDDEGLSDWLTGTGEFDGARKPNAQEVVNCVGNDPELAQRMLAAEKATREAPRGQVEAKLSALAEGDAEDQGE